MTVYNVVNPSALVAGQSEDISVVLANFNAIAAILNGGLDNSNIAAGAGIPYSKLALAAGIVNGDVSPAAALAVSKLAPGTVGQTLVTQAGPTVGWGAGGSGTELDYVSGTAPITLTSTTEAGANTLLTGNSVTYDGSKVKIEVFCPNINPVTNQLSTLVLLRDSTVLGQIVKVGGNGVNWGGTVVTYDTPSAAAHSYVLKGFSAVGTAVWTPGAGGSGNLAPAYMRVTKA